MGRQVNNADGEDLKPGGCKDGRWRGSPAFRVRCCRFGTGCFFPWDPPNKHRHCSLASLVTRPAPGVGRTPGLARGPPGWPTVIIARFCTSGTSHRGGAACSRQSQTVTE